MDDLDNERNRCLFSQTDIEALIIVIIREMCSIFQTYLDNKQIYCLPKQSSDGAGDEESALLVERVARPEKKIPPSGESGIT